MTGGNTVSLTNVASGIILYRGIPAVEHLENAGHSSITSRRLLGVLIVYAEARANEKDSVRALYSSQINPKPFLFPLPVSVYALIHH